MHSEHYLEVLNGVYAEEEKRETVYIKDTYVNKYTLDCARKSAGGVLKAIELVHSKELDNCFAVVRPPGHHAGDKHICHGFSFYNNIAIGARKLTDHYKYSRVLIFDWDIHHCDGTQAIFYDDPRVLVVSLHRYDKGNGDKKAEKEEYEMIKKNKISFLSPPPLITYFLSIRRNLLPANRSS